MGVRMMDRMERTSAAADYEGDGGAPFMPGERSDRFNVVARFPTPASAAQAVARVRAARITPTNVSVLGGERDLVQPGSGISRSEGKVIGSVARHSLTWAGSGLVVGALAGIVLILIPAFRSAAHARLDWPAFLAAGLIGAIVCGIGAQLIGYVAGLDRKFTQEDTYSDLVAGGPTLVGVHTDSEPQTRQVTQALHEAGALSVDAVAAGGRQVG